MVKMHSTNKEGEHTSTHCERDNGHRDGYMLPHDDPAKCMVFQNHNSGRLPGTESLGSIDSKASFATLTEGA